MRLVSYKHNGGWRAGADVAGRVVDLARTAAAADIAGAHRCERVRGALALQPDEFERLAAAVQDGAAAAVGALDEVELGPPVPDPEKILCVGLNYYEHIEEAGHRPADYPILFAKFRNSLVGPTAGVRIPRGVTDRVDYEGELAIVIGRHANGVREEEAVDYIAGAMAFNDVSARDLQLRTSQWLPGKAIDTFAPCGPALVTLDEVGDLTALQVTTRVNGEVRQDASTSLMMFSVAELIATISSFMTLAPGDIIATGTPGGVGSRREPPSWLAAGDIVEVEVGGVGTLANTME
jgi:2-keto-4-pentenoate hydratase/2-oxohepta-3-ene-1,7-dioic acid hydratase in catechol pathway